MRPVFRSKPEIVHDMLRSSIIHGEYRPGERLVIREVADEDAERLRYLAALGLCLDTELTVVDVAPFDGPITVRVGPREHALGRALAATVWVEPA